MESNGADSQLQADVIVVGAGLSGLVATAEAYNAGASVLLLDQEPAASLGGQAHWSFGGLFLVDSAEQRHLGVNDSEELALTDWFGSADFDRTEDYWAREWAKAYVHFAAGEKRQWLHSLGVRFFPLVQWAERGGYGPQGHGNSVPRFHVTWGTGPGVLAPFIAKVEEGVANGRITLAFRHRATELEYDGGTVVGVNGQVLLPSDAARGEASNREVVSEFIARGWAIIVTTGGIGGDHIKVRQQWPGGKAPATMITGVPASTDGDFVLSVAQQGGNLVNSDRMWHYPEGIHNTDPVWPDHGIRILSGPSPLWLDATGKRFPAPLFPGFDSLGALRHLETTGYDHSWFVLNKTIIAKEFALSGSEQNPDLTEKDMLLLAKRVLPGASGPVQNFIDNGIDFIQAVTPQELATKMNQLVGEDLINPQGLFDTIHARDLQVKSGLGKDPQLNAIREARRFSGDKLMRVVPPHQMSAPEHGPLIAVRLNVLTRKSLGGLQTNLDAQVLDAQGVPIPGLFAAGEAAGFGGGGIHGYRSLEGTFLGGCLFSGKIAGKKAAQAIS